MTDQVVDLEAGLGEAADGEGRPLERDGRDHDVDARAVLEPRVHHRRALVDAAADPADHAVDDLHQLVGGLEAVGGQREPARTLDPDLMRPVDHDLGDGGIGEHPLQGAEAQQLVMDPGDRLHPLREAERLPQLAGRLVDQLGEPLAHRVVVGLRQVGGVLDEPGVDHAAEHVVAGLDGVVGSDLLLRRARAQQAVAELHRAERGERLLERHLRKRRRQHVLGLSVGGAPPWHRIRSPPGRARARVRAASPTPLLVAPDRVLQTRTCAVRRA